MGFAQSRDLQGRRARCRRARSWANPSMHTWLGQVSDPHGRPARCRSPCRRSAAPEWSVAPSVAPSVTWSATAWDGTWVAGSACRALTQVGTGQLLRPHGSPFPWAWACASALRCAFFRRRRSRSGAHVSQPRTLQIRPREWAVACSCFGVSRGSSAAIFGERPGCPPFGARGTGRSAMVQSSIAEFARRPSSHDSGRS